ncbi:acyltransferase family protein [Alteromonas oceanisediminis]|uniref:acyltransferase family protein n=1 Tax=Alteromonas oceanisediminis TaxID=2836180 RepID=UPI001BDAA871|nr:acyltransferase family protein [Alteromonas oceanisediminis]MBT0585670.1 acyltransferase [Alteromonas oceanisediminis]
MNFKAKNKAPGVGKSKYRADIDGLRAIAVLLVILCHMEIALFSGGFIGVDIFFVLSGFLITSIIHREISTGTFSFAHFYVRRIRRLLPALAFLLFCCVIAFSTTLSPADLQKFAASLIWVTLFAGNFFFWIHHGGYFSENAKEAPLLHTWSLAIEEQFYFVWPIILVLMVRWLPPRVLLSLSGVALLALAAFSEWALNYSAGASYYLLPTRFFELLVGAVLALSWRYVPKPNRWVAALLSVIALIVLFYLATSLTSASRFPGLNALYVCLATACLLYCGQQANSPVTKLLSLRPMVFVGLISYSLYLWHWPMLVWLNYRGIALSEIGLMIVFVLMLFAAWFSWRFVEQPFRHNQWSLRKLASVWFFAPLCVAGSTLILINVNDGFPQRFTSDVKQIEAALLSHSNEIRGDCHASFSQRTSRPSVDCMLGEKSGQRSGFLFGDSHANHFTGFLDVVGQQRDLAITDFTMDQCPPIFDLEWGASALRANGCVARNQAAREFIQEQQPDIVFLAASWPNISTKLLYQNGESVRNADSIEQLVYAKLYNTLEAIIAAGATPVIIQDIVYAGQHDPKCSLKNAMFGSDMACQLPRSQNDMMQAIYARLKASFGRLEVIDVKPLYCADDVCETSLDGVPLYRDNDHLNHQASELLGVKFLTSRPAFLF